MIDLDLKTQMLLQAFLYIWAMNGFMIQLRPYSVLLILSDAGLDGRKSDPVIPKPN